MGRCDEGMEACETPKAEVVWRVRDHAVFLPQIGNGDLRSGLRNSRYHYIRGYHGGIYESYMLHEK